MKLRISPCLYANGVVYHSPALPSYPGVRSPEFPLSVFNSRKVCLARRPKIRLTEMQHAIFEQISRSTTVARRLAQRADLILLAFRRGLNMTIADEIGLARKQVGLSRRRWQDSSNALVAIECR